MRLPRFFERFEKFCIPLIFNKLSLDKNFHIFALVQKLLEVLNFHFGRKYHFVKNGKLIFVMFLRFFSGKYSLILFAHKVDVFNGGVC